MRRIKMGLNAYIQGFNSLESIDRAPATLSITTTQLLIIALEQLN